jgi:FixJ family two-component response regulator
MIAIVDDDLGVREAISGLLRSLGFATQCYASAEDFLLSLYEQRARCLILDVTLPGLSGPDLQQHLARRGLRIPIVFISARPDFREPAQALTSEADFLLKPFTEEQLLDAVHTALTGPAAAAAGRLQFPPAMRR